MIADHIYYPQEMMESFANANRNMSFQYVDYRLSKFSLPTVTATIPAAAAINAQNGRPHKSVISVERVVLSPRSSGVSRIPPRKITLLRRVSIVRLVLPETYSNPILAANSTGRLTSNIKYNEQFLFPIDVTNSARHFHNVVQAEGMTPHLAREVYSNEGVSLSGSVDICSCGWRRRVVALWSLLSEAQDSGKRVV